MNRVVVTGLGAVSSIGNNAAEVLVALQKSRSGIERVPEMRELGFRCQVGGTVKGLEVGRIGKRAQQTMSNVAKFAAVAALEAVEDAGLGADELRSERAGVVVGSSFGGVNEIGKAERLLLQHRNPLRLGATGLLKIMHSTAAANLAAWLGIEGRAYSLCSSFCSGTDCIGHGYELIRRGELDVCLCGAAEEAAVRQVWSCMDGLHALPGAWNDQPEKACRPYDRRREGPVLSEGAGIVVLESLQHAGRRDVRPYAEIVGYGSSNDGLDMFRPSGDGLTECLTQGLRVAHEQGVRKIDYINAHGTGTAVHDALEVKVIRELFGAPSPLVSSTKALAGHALGAAGAQEAVFTLLMLRHGFVAPTVNLEEIAPECAGVSHVQAVVEVPLRAAMSFSAGLGGTCACLVFRTL